MPQESAEDFLLRKPVTFAEFLIIGDPKTQARIDAMLRLFPKTKAREALIKHCMDSPQLTTVPAERQNAH